jgi:hypothetical protein
LARHTETPWSHRAWELAIERALETYLRKGYSKEWIDQRLKTIEVRKALTDEWDSRGVQKGVEYAILTDEITKAWAELSTVCCVVRGAA